MAQDPRELTSIQSHNVLSFLLTSVPTPGPTLGFVWLPVTRLCLRYLAITPTPFIQTYDRGVMVEFWRNIPLTRNKILFPERFSFHGPFFFQPPAIIPVTSCVDIPGPFVGGIGPGFIGNFGGGVGIPGNGGFFGNGIGRPINGGGIGVRGFGGGRRGGSNFNPFPDLQFNRRGTLPIQNLRSAGNGNKNSDEELQGEGERGGGGSLFSWLPPLKLTSQRISEMQKKVEDFLGL
ncbi:hypothetical protein SK128_019435 [Halocaridina rubra]|uniref:Uncharacterized protein n=1 Tax=Halocaridina rubra TaxID=373956 RepID=A0AAN8WLG8_HALRR